METFAELTTFAVESCCNCHVQFAMTDALRRQRLKDGKPFYCPNGHSQYYSENDDKKWKRILENERSTTEYYRNQTQIARLSLRATKGEVTKLKKRVMAGMCPCCDRKFANLEKHMAKIHPDFIEVEKDDQRNGVVR